MTPAAQAPVPGPVDAALRRLLTASGQARTALARRLGMGVRDVEAVEHVMLSGAPPEITGRRPEALGPVELSRLLGVTSAAGTQALDRLEAQGHLRRTAHPQDGRRRRVEVTDSGREHVMSRLGPLLAELSAVSGRLSPTEAEAVVRYLGQVTEVLEAYAAPEVDDPSD